MFIKDGIYRSIKPQVALPIAEGTVLTINGLAATADTAYGIVPANITALSPTKQIYVAVSGTIDLKDPANKNVSFSKDMIKALGKDFNFVPGEEGSGEGGGGGVFVVHLSGSYSSGDITYSMDKTRSEILSALNDGTAVFMMFGASLGILVMDEGYPEIYGNLTQIADGDDGGILYHYYVEIGENGDVSVTRTEFALTFAT